MAILGTGRTGSLTPDKVLMIRHRAFNARRATGKAAVECEDLLQQILDVDAVIELTSAWLRQRQDKNARRAVVVASKAKIAKVKLVSKRGD